MNEYSEKWEEICFLLSENIKPSFSEKDFENQVVRALEVLGWREFRNEIERQPTIQLGREGTLRPDLIIFDQGKRALIVLEVKRPIEDITKDDTIGQLRSYMRQMKSDFGFLVGSELRVYYDGPSNPQSDPLLLEKISFARNSTEGINFTKNFNKNSFLEKEYTQYLEKKIKKFSMKREINKLTELILSEDTNQKITGYLRKEFADYGDETFSEAMKKLSITITNYQPQDQQVQATTVRPPITTNLPPKSTVRAKIKVTFPDGVEICLPKVADTMVEVINKIGIERVRALNIQMYGFPIVSDEKHRQEKYNWAEAKLGLYIFTHSNTGKKMSQLNEINDALSLGLVIEKV